MNKEELQQIADQSNFKWIKVKKFDSDKYVDSADELFDLRHHHKAETTFLINKCRELALIVLELQKENSSLEDKLDNAKTEIL